MGFLPIIRYNKDNPNCKEIKDIAAKLSKNSTSNEEDKNELDIKVAAHYGVNTRELNLLKNHYKIMQGIIDKK